MRLVPSTEISAAASCNKGRWYRCRLLQPAAGGAPADGPLSPSGADGGSLASPGRPGQSSNAAAFRKAPRQPVAALTARQEQNASICCISS